MMWWSSASTRTGIASAQYNRRISAQSSTPITTPPDLTQRARPPEGVNFHPPPPVHFSAVADIQALADESQAPRLAVHLQQSLGHRQADELRVAEQRRTPSSPVGDQLVVDLHLQFGDEGLDVSLHTPIIEALATSTASALGTSRLGRSSRD